ncbi:alpha-amylase [Nonomuraea sp. NN258]|nr:alpha-amylase [Nonomuraea antri]
MPVIYEVNTRVWLSDVARRHGRPMLLQDVPKQEWDELAMPGIDTIWLMGVWERSGEGRAIALADPELRRSFADAVPHLSDDDVVGSPYCVRDYVPDQALGGPEGLAAARAALNRRRLALLLDYVPNHVAPDHPWLRTHPQYFIRGAAEDLRRDPAAFLGRNGQVYARGRDPYFAPWPDVVQLNAFAPGLRTATVNTLARIGELCDGVRCDMAMLMTNDVFARTWGEAAGSVPGQEFWTSVIERVRRRRPGMTFVAEAYWDLEWTLQQQGFDFCYDKRLYDRLVSGDVAGVRAHLGAGLDYQRRLVRFLENHDEPRAAATLGPVRERAAATAIATLPGAMLWHEGQFEGRRAKVPVFLSRRLDEPPVGGLRDFHARLLSAVHASGMRTGEWRMADLTGWPDNRSCDGMLAWSWSGAAGRHLIAINLQDRAGQARVPLDWPDLPGRRWVLRDLLTGASYERDGAELRDPGLYVALDGWHGHVFSIEPIQPVGEGGAEP